MVASSSASNRKSSATAKKSKTRCSRGKLHPSVRRHTCLTTAFFLVNTRKHQHYPDQAVVANCVCLCSSDCESREVLTLLCQGKMFAEIYYHCPTHCGPSLTFFHMLMFFSCDLCVFLCFCDTCTSCLVFLIPSFMLACAYLVCFASVVSLNDATLLAFDFLSALSPQTAASVVLRQTA